jgi:hypothetical protein
MLTLKGFAQDDSSAYTPCSVGWNLRLQLPAGRRELRCYLRWCWWPVNGGAKAVKKEKLFERREMLFDELLLPQIRSLVATFNNPNPVFCI